MYVNPGNGGFAGILADEYVDKTGLISLVNAVLGTPRKLVCSTRPRRFGKTFAAESLVAYYTCGANSRELFEGLEIFALESAREGAWTSHPVFHLDLDGADYSAAGALEVKLEETLCDWEEIWGDTYNKRSLSGRFAKLLERAAL
jgi:hypothetical protein